MRGGCWCWRWRRPSSSRVTRGEPVMWQTGILVQWGNGRGSGGRGKRRKKLKQSFRTFWNKKRENSEIKKLLREKGWVSITERRGVRKGKGRKKKKKKKNKAGKKRRGNSKVNVLKQQPFVKRKRTGRGQRVRKKSRSVIVTMWEVKRVILGEKKSLGLSAPAKPGGFRGVGVKKKTWDTDMKKRRQVWREAAREKRGQKEKVQMKGGHQLCGSGHPPNRIWELERSKGAKKRDGAAPRKKRGGWKKPQQKQTLGPPGNHAPSEIKNFCRGKKKGKKRSRGRARWYPLRAGLGKNSKWGEKGFRKRGRGKKKKGKDSARGRRGREQKKLL